MASGPPESDTGTLEHRARALFPEDPQLICVNFTNVNHEFEPRAFYSGLEIDRTVGQIIRQLENAGSYILSVAFDGGVLDVRLSATRNNWRH